MRRVKPWMMNGCAAAALTGAVIWGATEMPTAPRMTALHDHAAESLSTVGLSVEEVLVTGRVKTDPAALLDALGAVRGTPILDLDIPAARERINALPWVKSSQVVRRLPNSVSIALEEHVAFALWQREGRYTLVARGGDSIIDVEAADTALPVIVGADAPLHVAALYEALSVDPQLSGRVVAAVRYGARRWDVIVDDADDGITIKLPEDGVSAAWITLAALDAKHRILSRAISVIDLRVQGRTIVRLKEGYSVDYSKSGPKQEARATRGVVATEEFVKGV